MSARMHSRFATNNLTGNERDYAAFVPSSVYCIVTLGIWKEKKRRSSSSNAVQDVAPTVVLFDKVCANQWRAVVFSNEDVFFLM